MDLLQKYRALEDEEVRQASKRYYGHFLRICSILPCIDEGWLAFTAVYSILVVVGSVSYSIVLGISSFFLLEDILLFGIEGHYYLLVQLVTILFFYVYYKRERICDLLRMMNRFYDYGDTDITEEEKQGMEKIIKTQRLLLIPAVILVGITASFMCLFGPLIDTLVGAGETRTYVNGVYVKGLIPLYLPFDVQSELEHYVAVAIPVVVTAMLTPVLGGSILLYIVSCQFLAKQHRYIIMSIRKLFERSAVAYQRMYHVGIREHWSNLCDDDKFQNCVSLCMKQNILHHQRIREYFDIMGDMLQLPLLLTFTVATFIMAFALFALTEKTNRTGLLLTNVISMFTEVTIIYIVCFFGEEILELGEETNEAVYAIEWYYLNKKNKKLLISMQDITRNPFTIKAWVIFDCNMETYSSIINTAYSYFNMLTASSAARNS